MENLDKNSRQLLEANGFRIKSFPFPTLMPWVKVDCVITFSPKGSVGAEGFADENLALDGVVNTLRILGCEFKNGKS